MAESAKKRDHSVISDDKKSSSSDRMNVPGIEKILQRDVTQEENSTTSVRRSARESKQTSIMDPDPTQTSYDTPHKTKKVPASIDEQSKDSRNQAASMERKNL